MGMNANRRQTENDVDSAGYRRGRVPAWLPIVAGVLAVAIMIVMGICVLRKDDGAPKTTSPGTRDAEAQGKMAVAKPVGGGKLVGRWLRLDGSYVLEITSVSPDGRVDAAYFNPNPIHVSKAEASSEKGEVQLFVELRDRGYDGNYYTLAYDRVRDCLAGVYHQLAMGQEYDVEFVRMAR
jgi:hypothetical protein